MTSAPGVYGTSSTDHGHPTGSEPDSVVMGGSWRAGHQSYLRAVARRSVQDEMMHDDYGFAAGRIERSSSNLSSRGAPVSWFAAED